MTATVTTAPEKDDSIPSPEVESAPEWSADGARSLMELLVERGYFHDHAGSSSIQTEIEGDSLEIFRSTSEHVSHSVNDENCRLIPRLGPSEDEKGEGCYYTRQGLREAIQIQFSLDKGRIRTNTLLEAMGVKSDQYSRIAAELPSSIAKVGDELISDKYWRDQKASIQTDIQRKGCMTLSEIVGNLQLPVNVVEANCIPTIDGSVILMQSNGGTALCSKSHVESLRNKVVATFQNQVAPISVAQICQKHGWDQVFVLTWIKDPEIVHGGLHCDDFTSAQFIPHVYSKHQEEAVKELFSANGYLTADVVGRLHGILPARMMQIVLQNFLDAVVLEKVDCVVASHIVDSVQLALQESASSQDLIDLQDHIPLELLSRPKIIIQLCEQPQNMQYYERCKVIVVEGQGVVISNIAVKKLAGRILPPLIESFAKHRAAQIDKLETENASRSSFKASDDGDNDDEGAATHNNRKRSKRKGKKGIIDKHQSSADNNMETNEVVPLLQVAGACAKESPGLLSEGSEDEIMQQAEKLSWDDEEDTGILLIDFCKRALYTPDFEKQCNQAVRIELKRLQSVRTSKCSISRKDAAATIRSVDGAFEDAYVDACYMIQVGHKFLEYASNSTRVDATSLAMLHNEFLKGPCADFTSRLTQFSLFKMESEDGIFSFKKEDESIEQRPSSPLPPYCQPVDTATVQSASTYLACAPLREPLPVLRETLSGTVGIALARQWIMCGGECYLGGIRKKDGVEHIRAGNVEEFVSHVNENCLSICGFPFKKLDKKAEKQFLFCRKHELVSKLERATDALLVLKLTIMILYQQVKQLVVSGSLLCGPILQMICDERKIPESVATLLKSVASGIEQEEIVDEHLIEAMKECSLCKDISKHNVTAT